MYRKYKGIKPNDSRRDTIQATLRDVREEARKVVNYSMYDFYELEPAEVESVLLDESIFDVFRLYLGLDSLYTMFATESFLLIFWLHFLALNLFLGSWISKDGIRYNMSRSLVVAPLILVYFTGPLGLVLYWLIRVFCAKRLSFHD